MQKESKEAPVLFPETANVVFDAIQDQIFKDQFTSETGQCLDKIFFQTIMSKEIDVNERIDFVLMYLSLKKLLAVVSKKQVPKTINEITVDISYYFS